MEGAHQCSDPTTPICIFPSLTLHLCLQHPADLSFLDATCQSINTETSDLRWRDGYNTYLYGTRIEEIERPHSHTKCGQMSDMRNGVRVGWI